MNRNGLLLAKEAGHQHSLSIHQDRPALHYIPHVSSNQVISNSTYEVISLPSFTPFVNFSR